MAAERLRRSCVFLLVAMSLAAIAAPRPAVASSVDDALEEARRLESEGRQDDAEALLRRTLESGVAARHPALLLAIARLSPSPEESVELCGEVIAATRDARLAGEARLLRGDYLYARGSYAEAVREYDAALGGPRDIRWAAALKRAASLLAGGDAPAAEDAYRSAVDTEGLPQELRPWVEIGLGRALLARGAAEEAAERFEATARAHPDHDARLAALAGAARSHEEAGDAARAAVSLAAIVAEFPGTYDAVLAEERLRGLAETAPRSEESPDSTAATQAP